MNKDNIIKLCEIRIAIALLGEKKAFWNSEFYHEDSKSFLDYIFPRSKNANVFASFEVASAEIDKHIGANYFHVFRLGVKNEELLFRTIEEQNISLDNEDKAFKVLEKYSEGMSIETSSGPKNIGNIDHLFDGDLISVIAAEYLHAFKGSYQVFPYLNI